MGALALGATALNSSCSVGFAPGTLLVPTEWGLLLSFEPQIGLQAGSDYLELSSLFRGRGRGGIHHSYVNLVRLTVAHF